MPKLNDIENIWLRRASLLLVPYLLLPAIIWAVVSVAWTEVLRHVPRDIWDTTLLMWKPKRRYH